MGARAQVKCARLYASGVGAFLVQTKSSDVNFLGPMDATRIELATDQSDASLPRSRFPARLLTGFNLLGNFERPILTNTQGRPFWCAPQLGKDPRDWTNGKSLFMRSLCFGTCSAQPSPPPLPPLPPPSPPSLPPSPTLLPLPLRPPGNTGACPPRRSPAPRCTATGNSRRAGAREPPGRASLGWRTTC